MSVTLFHCPHCDTYFLDAVVRLYVSATLEPRCGMLRVSDDASLPEGYSIPLEDIVESHCPECSRVAELVALDECPHRWGSGRIDQWGKLYNVCQFCGEVREGEIKYVTEFSG